jgi:hypothetical protein
VFVNGVRRSDWSVGPSKAGSADAREGCVLWLLSGFTSLDAFSMRSLAVLQDRVFGGEQGDACYLQGILWGSHDHARWLRLGGKALDLP